MKTLQQSTWFGVGALLAAVPIAIAGCPQGGSGSNPSPGPSSAAATTNPNPTPTSIVSTVSAHTLFLRGDTVINAHTGVATSAVDTSGNYTGTVGGVYNPSALTNCNQENRFAPGGRVVFRFKAFDPYDGSEMSSNSIYCTWKDSATPSHIVDENGIQPAASSSFVLNILAPAAIATGPIPLIYAKHGTDWLWVTGWSVPLNSPAGTVSYSVTATDRKNRTGTFSQFGIAPAQLTIDATGSYDPTIPYGVH